MKDGLQVQVHQSKPYNNQESRLFSNFIRSRFLFTCIENGQHKNVSTWKPTAIALSTFSMKLRNSRETILHVGMEVTVTAQSTLSLELMKFTDLFFMLPTLICELLRQA